MWQIWTCVFGFLVTVTPSVTTVDEQNGAASGRSIRSTKCALPAYPEHGTFVILNGNNTPAQIFYDTLLLSVNCHQGHGIEGMSYGENILVLCAQGVWYQTMPKCVRFCKLDPALEASVDYICYRPDMGIRPCGGFLPPGTVVNPVCKTPYYSSEILANMVCVYGQWSYMAKCKPECGRVVPKGGGGLIIGGTNAAFGQVPWHVGIYRKTSSPYEQICGGTIVTNNVVISAAHCFWNGVLQKAFPPSRFGVAGGKIYRPWADKVDVNAQKSNVKEIKLPSLYQGAVGHFGVDIAGLILVTPFVYNPFVRPVCLSFDSNFERWQLQHGKLGKAVGWGLTLANGNYSSILQVLDLPFINDETCLTTVPQHFRPYITGDKFCAGYTNGTALCQGDSGGGLSFPDKEQGIDRFYFRGVVSTAARSEDNDACNDHTYTAFTKITTHQDFIRSVIAVSEQKGITCQGAACSVAALGYGDSVEKARWWSIGTILTDKFILTSANSTTLVWSLRYAAVGVKSGVERNPDWQIHIVKRVHQYPVYKEQLLNGYSYYYDDIALLELETPITFSTDVLPACLPEPSQDVGSAKYFKGHEGKIFDVMKITTEACDAWLNENHLWYPQKTKKESQLCYSIQNTCYDYLDGTPLILTNQQSHCVNTVIGLQSWRFSCQTAVFTKVEHYLPWIESIVGPSSTR